jgi:hypothetical protein
VCFCVCARSRDTNCLLQTKCGAEEEVLQRTQEGSFVSDRHTRVAITTVGSQPLMRIKHTAILEHER